MRRRRFLHASLATGLTIGIAGCSTGDESSASPADSEEPEQDGQTQDDPAEAVRYFFDDQTGALGHLGDDTIPDDHDHVITNDTTEAEYREMQRNDRLYAEDTASWKTAPNPRQGGGLDMTVDEMIDRTEEIYNNPTEHIDVSPSHEDIDLLQEDDEIVFTRALVQAAQEAGTDSSGLADIVTANMAEDAVDQIQPDFTNYKLSTIDATEPTHLGGTGTHGGAKRTNEWDQTFVNSGFRHLPGLLQYEKNGEAKVKYAELTDATDVNTFRRAIRDPEFSLYRSDLEMDSVSNARDSEPGDTGTMFPEHYVTAFDYEKARELESRDILGLGDNGNGGFNAIGDYLAGTIIELVDDMGITGYDNNPDRDLDQPRVGTDGKLVSDSFGESVEDYVTNPDTETRQYLENIGRALYLIHEYEGWNETEIAITGTLENPEFIPTDQDTINRIRRNEAYDEVRSRVT